MNDVETYYDQTWWDYRFLWLDRGSLAFHFGYDDPDVRGHRAALVNANRVLATLSGVGPGKRVLDAGCGMGGSSFWLASGRGASTVGVTVTRSQVLEARRRAQLLGLADRTRFLQASYTDVPCPDASFDVVWALESLCHAGDKRSFYAEASRLLKPGGRLVVAEYMRAARSLPEPDERLLQEWLEGWVIPDLDTAEEHVAHARACGLLDAGVEDYTPRVRRSLRRLYRIAGLTYPLALAGYACGIRSPVQHGNTRAALLQYRALNRGLWHYGVLLATKPVG